MTLRFARLLLGILVALLGLAAVLGDVFALPSLAHLFAGLPSSGLVAGWGLCLAGVGIAASALRRSWLAGFGGTAAGFLGAAGILAPELPGHPPLATSFALALAGAAVAVEGRSTGQANRATRGDAFLSLLAGMTGVSLLIVAFVITPGVDPRPEPAVGLLGVHVVLGLWGLGLGLTLGGWFGREDVPAKLREVRRWGLGAGCVAALCVLALWQVLAQRERERLEGLFARRSGELALVVNGRLNESARSLEHAGRHWVMNGAVIPEAWRARMASALVHAYGYRQLALTDADARVEWALPAAQTLPAAASLPDAVHSAHEHRNPELVLAERPGHLDLVLVHPVRVEVESGISRFFVATLPLDELLRQSLDQLGLVDELSVGCVFDQHEISVLEVSGTPDPDWVRREPLQLLDRHWSLEVRPTARWLSRHASPVPEVGLCMGLLLAAAASCIAVYGAWERTRARELTVTATQLAHEVRAHQDSKHRIQLQASDLHRAAMELSASNQELEQFAYVAAHDLRSPLRAIANLATWIEEDLEEKELEPETVEHLTLMRGRVRRMEALLDSLLEFSRAGRIPLPVETVAPEPILQRVVDQSQAEGAGFAVDVKVAPEVTQLRLPPQALERVLVHLVDNAVKHHDEAPGRVGLSVAPNLSGPGWIFEVHDDGPGIPPAFHEQVFTLFKTLRPRDHVEGSGVGLALVKKLVERYGGTVTLCEGPPGPDGAPRGTTVRVFWPPSPGSSA